MTLHRRIIGWAKPVQTKTYDIAIIGGGINGCGITRDAAGRGLSVLLAEQNDLASGTSSASTKLIHGGLRYLEYYEFGLVRESLIEREVLWAMAPHIIQPMRFVLPHHVGLRPAWLIRLGLFLYDHIGGRRRLPASHSIDLQRDPAGEVLKSSFTRGFEYSDCWVDDARLVVLNAVDAARRGADIRVRTQVESATPEGATWRIALTDSVSGRREEVSAQVLVNAAGPWVADVIGRTGASPATGKVRLVKGSHIVVPRLFDHDRAYILQNTDQRVVFAIPYERDFTLIGTTDVDVSSTAPPPAATPEEVAYLCAVVSAYFSKPVTAEDVVWSFAGIRPLYDEGGESAQEVTRDYLLDLRKGQGTPPMLNVFGGKITTYRRLAEEALKRLESEFPAMADAWTRTAPLPGGAFPAADMDGLIARLGSDRPSMDQSLIRRLARAYGTMAEDILGDATEQSHLGTHFGADLYEREVAYLLQSEWARTAEDILWRRSKLGLKLTDTQAEALDHWLLARNAET